MLKWGKALKIFCIKTVIFHIMLRFHGPPTFICTNLVKALSRFRLFKTRKREISNMERRKGERENAKLIAFRVSVFSLWRFRLRNFVFSLRENAKMIESGFHRYRICLNCLVQIDYLKKACGSGHIK